MNSTAKITAHHLGRRAIVYVRQSTAAQVHEHRESTDRQYQLTSRARELGWPHAQIEVIDQDLGISGGATTHRAGFEQLTSMVALGGVGIVFGLEVSRLARNNRDWYQLLDLCSVTDTLIGDGDGVYHPALPDDRLILGLRGTMSEAELHVMQARLQGGSRNKATRGELRVLVPIGFVWKYDADKPQLDPDEAVTGALRTVFRAFSERGSIRQVWLWLRAEGLDFPQRVLGSKDVRWVTPTYIAIREVLTSPVYAGVYVYGKTRTERYVDEQGHVRRRRRKLPRAEWEVMIREHHEGFIDWETFEENQKRIAANMRPDPQDTGGPAREGAALLQGLGRCGHCGRGLRVVYGGQNNIPYYYCASDQIIADRGVRCLWISGRQIHKPVVSAFLSALAPAGLEASLRASTLLEEERDAALEQWRLQVERARYEASAAERRYRAVDPENRLVARGLEARWEECLQELQATQAELVRRETSQPRALTPPARRQLLRLGKDLHRVWSLATSTDKDRKELMRALLEEVQVTIPAPGQTAHITLRWHGGLLTDLDVTLSHRRAHNRTDEDTVDLIRRLARHYPDATIAGILNRQGRTTSRGLCFTGPRIVALRQHWKIPCFQAPAEPPKGELAGVSAVAKFLAMDRSTVHHWLREGFIPGEQLTPGAPWRVQITDEFRARFREEAPSGYVTMREATRILGVSRQTVWNRVKRGELDAAYVRRGRAKGLRIRILDNEPTLFERSDTARTQSDE
jgi:DNA invertase Pin-like site-specific DNA recombinase